MLDALFRAVPAESITNVVRATPTGTQARRLWFLYEWLRAEQLDLPDAAKVKAVPAVDTRMQFALAEGGGVKTAPGAQQPARHAGVLSDGAANPSTQ